jgi:hypothetical protein
MELGAGPETRLSCHQPHLPDKKNMSDRDIYFHSVLAHLDFQPVFRERKLTKATWAGHAFNLNPM